MDAHPIPAPPLALRQPPRSTAPSRSRRAATLAAALAAAVLLAHPRAARAQQPLQDSVRAQLDRLPARSSIYAVNLKSGDTVSVRPDQPMNTLSVIKLPVLVAAFRDAEAGQLDLDARYTIRPEDLRRGSGLLQTFAPGLQPTWRDILTQMIVTSDNTATDLVIRRVGPARVNALLDTLGLRQTRLRSTTGQLFRGVWALANPANDTLSDRTVFLRGFPSDSQAARRSFAFEGDSTKWLGRSTAREMTRLLTLLYQGKLANAADTKAMIDILLQQFYSSRLPRRIAFRADVAHKTGDWPPYAGNDVGIILYPGGPTVVSVFTNQNRGSFYDLEDTIGRIAEELIDTWK